MVDFVVTALGLPFLLAGAVVLRYGANLSAGLLRRRRQTRAVEATVVETSATETAGDTFEPTVRFQYEHDGRTYESTQIFEGRDPPTGPREVVDSFLERYDEGETVTATFLTSTPDAAVLERSTDNYPYLVAVTTTLVGGAFTLLGVGVVGSGLLG